MAHHDAAGRVGQHHRHGDVREAVLEPVEDRCRGATQDRMRVLGLAVLDLGARHGHALSDAPAPAHLDVLRHPGVPRRGAEQPAPDQGLPGQPDALAFARRQGRQVRELVSHRRPTSSGAAPAFAWRATGCVATVPHRTHRRPVLRAVADQHPWPFQNGTPAVVAPSSPWVPDHSTTATVPAVPDRSSRRNPDDNDTLTRTTGTSAESDALRALYADWSDIIATTPGLTMRLFRSIFDEWHQPTREPEGVTYREETVGGVPGIWALPVGADTLAGPALHPRRRLRGRFGLEPPQAGRTRRQGARRHRLRPGLPPRPRAPAPRAGRGRRRRLHRARRARHRAGRHHHDRRLRGREPRDRDRARAARPGWPAARPGHRVLAVAGHGEHRRDAGDQRRHRRADHRAAARRHDRRRPRRGIRSTRGPRWRTRSTPTSPASRGSTSTPARRSPCVDNATRFAEKAAGRGRRRDPVDRRRHAARLPVLAGTAPEADDEIAAIAKWYRG